MAAVYFSPCSIFPGEVEDYYCISCHVTCSGLSLLVGPHTGHNCVPLVHATKYLPATLHRDAGELATDINKKYMQPKKAHCVTLNNTLNYMKRERAKKKEELELLQRDLCLLDEKIDAITQECALALCHWSHQRKGLLCKTRQLLRGADVLLNIVGSREKKAQSSGQNVTAGDAGANDKISFTTLRAMEEELHRVRELLIRPLRLLEEEEKWENENLQKGQQQQHDFDETDGAHFLAGVKEEKENEPYCWRPGSVAITSQRSAGSCCNNDTCCVGGGGGGGTHSYKNNENKFMSSDAADVLQQLLASRRGLQKTSFVGDELSFSPLHLQKSEQGDAARPDGVCAEKTVEKRGRWRSDVEIRERLLREGLNRCLYGGDFHTDLTATKRLTGYETDENDISGSSGGSSVSGGLNYFFTQPSLRR